MIDKESILRGKTLIAAHFNLPRNEVVLIEALEMVEEREEAGLRYDVTVRGKYGFIRDRWVRLFATRMFDIVMALYKRDVTLGPMKVKLFWDELVAWLDEVEEAYAKKVEREEKEDGELHHSSSD